MSPNPALAVQWTVSRVHEKEVFVCSLDGVEYVRATEASADVCVIPKSRGVPPLYLRRESSEHIRKLVARKERRLARRVNARKAKPTLTPENIPE